MLNKLSVAIMITVLMLAACAEQKPTFEPAPPSPFPEDPQWTPPPPGSEPAPLNPYAPGKGDESLKRSEVFIVTQEIVPLGGTPPQFELHMTGSLPSPCHGLRVVVDDPDERGQIHIQVFSRFDPGTPCAPVLEAFDAHIPLGSYPAGSYTVFVNGEMVGQINP